MFEVNFYDLDTVDERLFTRAVIVCRYNNKWIYCKHKDRETWEIPGGHIEEGEDYLSAAKRELYEETGATEFDIYPVCVYSISSYGILLFAEVKKLEELPNEYEMEKIGFFDDEPTNLTYHDSHSKFFKIVKEFLLKSNK